MSSPLTLTQVDELADDNAQLSQVPDKDQHLVPILSKRKTSDVVGTADDTMHKEDAEKTQPQEQPYQGGQAGRKSQEETFTFLLPSVPSLYGEHEAKAALLALRGATPPPAPPARVLRRKLNSHPTTDEVVAAPAAAASPTKRNKREHGFPRDQVARLGHGLEIRPSDIPHAGNGVFVTRDFPQGTLHVEYDGWILSHKQALESIERGNGGWIATLESMQCSIDAACRFCHRGMDGQQKSEPFETAYAPGGIINDPLNAKLCNGTFEKTSNEQSNGVDRMQRVDQFHTLYRLWFVNSRDLKAGEELYVSYGSAYWARETKWNKKLQPQTLTVCGKGFSATAEAATTASFVPTASPRIRSMWDGEALVRDLEASLDWYTTPAERQQHRDRWNLTLSAINALDTMKRAILTSSSSNPR
jgi:hypothetical protein